MLTFEMIIVFLGLTGMVTALVLDKMRPGMILFSVTVLFLCFGILTPKEIIIRKSKFPQNPKRSVRFSGKRTKRSVQKRKARNTQKAETKVL